MNIHHRPSEFQIAVQCLACGQTGVSFWADEDQTLSPDSSRTRLVLLSSGFRRIPPITPGGFPQIFCDRCRSKVSGGFGRHPDDKTSDRNTGQEPPRSTGRRITGAQAVKSAPWPRTPGAARA